MDTTINAPSWWEQVLAYTVTSVVDAKTRQPTLQTGIQYQIDAAGNIVPMGVVTPSTTPSATTQSVLSSPLFMVGALAVGALLLYKLVK